MSLSTKLGLFLTAIGTLAAVIAFFFVNQWLGWVFVAITTSGILALVLPPLWSLCCKCKTCILVISDLADGWERERFVKRVRGKVSEEEDKSRFFDCKEGLVDLCRTIDVHISNMPALIASGATPKAWTISTVHEVLPLIGALFRKFTGEEVAVQLMGRDETNMEKLRVLHPMTGVSPRRIRSQPQSCVLQGTVPGDVLDSGQGVIIPSVEKLAVDSTWRERPQFVNSMIAWPIVVDRIPKLVLKIDSEKKNTFRDTEASKLLAEICSRKLTVVLQIGLAFERKVSHRTNQGTTEALVERELDDEQRQ